MTVKGNEEASPLLRLPRNVRDRIWDLAYGSLVLHTEPSCIDQKMKPSGHYAFSYYFCEEPDQPLTSTQTTDCCATTRRDGKMTPFFWPIVDKQFWTEAIKMFYTTATFKVGNSIDLYILASSQQQSVRRMRNLIVRLGFGIKHHNRIWSPARCSNVIKNFENLKGLTLLIGRVVEDNENYSGTCMAWNYDDHGKPHGSVTRGSRLEGSSWEEHRNWFPVFLRSFQQHHLQPGLTRVVLFEREKCKQGKPIEYHPKDHRWRENPDLKRREDAVIQENLRKDLAASMRAVLLGQDIRLLFPDWEAENERLIQEYLPTPVEYA